jgi:YbbR domain-containing protein
MISHIRSFVQTNLLMKFLSLMFAFCFWLMWSSEQQTLVTLKVPVCFFNTSDEREITAPETLQVTLSGKRKNLLKLDPKNIAIHVDAQTLIEGEQLLKPTAEQLLLPLGVQVAQWNPAHVTIEVTELSEA